MLIQKGLLNLFCVLILGFTYSQSGSVQNLKNGLPVNVRYGVLDNGFTFYILKSDTTEKKIHISLINKVGSFNFNDPSQFGLAHLIEHLGFQGTTNFPNGIKKDLRKLGLKSGADFGASTGASTDYWIQIPTGDSIILNRSLLAAHDWAGERLFVHKEVEEERAAVKNEMERGNNPAFQYLLQVPYLLFDKNPLYEPRYKREFVNIDTTSISRLRKFEAKWYRPELQAIIIVGDINETIIEQKVKTLFSDLVVKDFTRPPLPDLERYQIQLDGRNKITILNRGQEGVVFAAMQQRKSNPLSSYTKEQRQREKFSDKLYHELVKIRLEKVLKKYDLNYSTLLHHIDRTAIDGLAGIDALITYINAPDLKSANKAFKFVNIELHRIRLWGFSESELIRAKQLIRKRSMPELKLPNANYLTVALGEHFTSQTPVTYTTLPEFDSLMVSVNLGDVNNMASKWLAQDRNINIKVELPDQESVNNFNKKELLHIFKKARSKKLSPYIETIPKSPFQGSISDTASCIATQLPKIDGVHLKLENGATVVIKRIGAAPTGYERFKGVEINGFSNKGAFFYKGDDRESAWLAPASVITAGVGVLDKEELSNWMAQKNTNGSLHIAPYIEYDKTGITGEASLDNAEELFKLVYLYFTQPRKDREAFLQYKRNNTPTLIKRNFEDSIRVVINACLAISNPQRSVTNAKFDRSVDIYRDIFSNAADFTFIIAGYFELDEMIKLAKKYLGGLPVGETKIKVVNDTVKINNQTYELRSTMVGDSTGNVQIRLLFPGSNANHIKNQLELEILSDIIQVKLHERLRTKEALVYSVHSYMTFARERGLYLLDINFETLPAKSEYAISCVINELSTLATNGFDEGLLIAAKRAVENRINGDLESQTNWISYIVSKLQRGEPLEDISVDAKIVQGITKADILLAAQKFLNTKHYSVFKLL